MGAQKDQTKNTLTRKFRKLTDIVTSPQEKYGMQ